MNIRWSILIWTCLQFVLALSDIYLCFKSETRSPDKLNLPSIFYFVLPSQVIFLHGLGDSGYVWFKYIYPGLKFVCLLGSKFSNKFGFLLNRIKYYHHILFYFKKNICNIKLVISSCFMWRWWLRTTEVVFFLFTRNKSSQC